MIKYKEIINFGNTKIYSINGVNNFFMKNLIQFGIDKDYYLHFRKINQRLFGIKVNKCTLK
jgi:hypothetical protein